MNTHNKDHLSGSNNRDGKISKACHSTSPHLEANNKTLRLPLILLGVIAAGLFAGYFIGMPKPDVPVSLYTSSVKDLYDNDGFMVEPAAGGAFGTMTDTSFATNSPERVFLSEMDCMSANGNAPCVLQSCDMSAFENCGPNFKNGWRVRTPLELEFDD